MLVKLSYLFCLLLLAEYGAAQALVLQLKDRKTMTSGTVHLADLLQSSQGLSDDDLALVLSAAPALGHAETWTRDRVESVLPDSLRLQDHQWTGAPQCLVDRPAQPFEESQVRQLIAAELGRQLPADAKFEVLELPGLQTFLIPKGATEARVEFGSGTLRNEWGDASLEFREQGQLAVTQSVRFHWSCTRKVWQSAARIPGGQPLASSDFQQVETNILKIPGLLEPATTFPENMVAAHGLMEGKILMENDWVQPTLVKRNDLVTVLYDHHGLSITLQAKAMASGTKDQVIEVENTSSHKLFNARIVNERTLVYGE